MYKGDLTLIIENSKAVIPVFTGGKSNVVIDPDELQISNKNKNPLENTEKTFKVRNNNPFKVVFCWMHGMDPLADKNRLDYLTQ